MKLSAFLAVLGLSASMISTYGQGSVFFSSYIANNGVGAVTTLVPGNFSLPVGYTATLYYALGTVSDPINVNSPGSTATPISAAFTLVAGSATEYDNSGAATGPAGLGYFDGPIVTIPGYVSGPVTFEIFVSNSPGTVFGRSGSFTMDSIAGPGLPAPALGDNGQPMPNFYIYIIPEPSPLALAGLGGLISLVVFRRRS